MFDAELLDQVEFIAKPFSSTDLIAAIRSVWLAEGDRRPGGLATAADA